MSTTVSGGPPQIIEVQIPGGPPGPQGPQGPPGASTLTDLTDVTGDPAYGKAPVASTTTEFPLTRVTTEDDLSKLLAKVAHVEWHNIGDPGEPPFHNDFGNFGEGYAPLRYRLTSNNIVCLEGMVMRAAPYPQTPFSVCQLPPECSPGATNIFCVAGGSNSISRVDIDNNGYVMWMGYLQGSEPSGDVYLSLCGITYSVGQTLDINPYLAATFTP